MKLKEMARNGLSDPTSSTTVDNHHHHHHHPHLPHQPDATYEDSQSDEEQQQYKALTGREEADLERLMLQCEFTIQNAQAFTEQLSKEVAQMDAQNIEKIMASEESVETLMLSLNCAVEETLRLEQRIEHYQNLLKNVRDVVLQVERKESQVKTERDNRIRLEQELQHLLTELDFSKESEQCLLDNDLSSRAGIRECIQAAERLQSHLNANIHPSLNYITAVQEQKAYLETVQIRFSERLCAHICHEIRHQLDRYAGDNYSTISSREWSLPSHDNIHNGLHVYKPLVKWLQANNLDFFFLLCEKYESLMKCVYDREISAFFEMTKEKAFVVGALAASGHQQMLQQRGGTMAHNESVGGMRRMNLGINTVGNNLDTLSANSSLSTGRQRSGSFQDNSDAISSKSECSLGEWEEFDSTVERILCAIDPICLSEQQFCMEFFNLEGLGSASSTTANTPSTLSANFNLDRRVSNVSNTNSVSHSLSNESQYSGENPTNNTTTAAAATTSSTATCGKTRNLREMMAKMFSILESEFIGFVMHFDRLDGMYSMYLLVRLTQHVLSTEDKGSSLSKTYGNVLIHVKRNFDKYMKSQLQMIKDTKMPKKPKCGIFPFIKRFEQFAKQAEQVFRNSSTRRTDIDRWYSDLVPAMFEQINTLAKDHHKTPTDMVLLENYHYLHNVLCTLKINCLETQRQEAKKRYNEALNNYVSRYFGRPLERLNNFFEGVQQKVAQGVREEEIGYQLAYSKQELRKVIKDCGLKEVKRGLEDMYRKVEKHISDPESTLIQVIWRSMQEEFISQYKSIQSLMQRCYPDANINLSFSVEDVLSVFSDIAQSH